MGHNSYSNPSTSKKREEIRKKFDKVPKISELTEDFEETE